MIPTKYNESYKLPQGIDEKSFYALIDEFINIAKDKGLTIRQAQNLFISCSDAILDTNIDDNNQTQESNYLKNISESLATIAINTGILSVRN